ncbi:malto-oligosyltrehalose trehalohydrolase [Pseudomonas sp. Marseille-Q8238]
MPLRVRTHGAQVQQNGITRFALWAPDCREVAVELTSEAVHCLEAQADGWFVGTCECVAGTGYRFIIDGRLRVPDPASQAQLDDVHGFSQVVDHATYRWQHRDWQGRPWHESVLYELHVGLLGGFSGVEQRLPALKALGITAIELMPLAEFPGSRNWGYDGVLPFAPESSYGTPKQLKSLVDSAHGLGLMVFVDVVYNHFGPDGNYLSHYASDFFRSDVQTPWGAAIDFRRREVRDYFCENALMWLLDYRVDGLRLDAVHAIGETDFLVELASRVRAAVEPGRHVHLVLENEDNNAQLLQHGFDAQWNDDGHNVLHALLTGEHEGYYADFAEDATAKLARCLGEGFIYQGQPNRHGRARGEPSAHLPPTAFVLFLQNHDQVGNRAFGERLIELANEDALKAATALLLLSPMVPLLFMGEEWGARQPFLFFTDHHAELACQVREGRRNEFADFALYADASVRERIPDPNALHTFSRSQLPENIASLVEHQHWYALYEQLLDIRHRLIIPRLPGATSLKSEVLGDGAVSAHWTLGDRSLLRIDLNIGERDLRISPPPTRAAVIFVLGVDSAGYQLGALPARSVAVSLEAAA